ncbi:MAG TPA: hypothetical protein VF589_01445 [Allosphingosinicella sp.]
MKFVLAAPLLAAVAASALSAQSPADQQRRQVRQVIVYGTDPCPRSTGDEIIVCSRRPETERYRIPEGVRDETDDDDPDNESWAERARSLDEPARAMTGPGACEPVGPGHHTGCTTEMLNAHRAAREAEEAEGPER